jgi:hypothetical protein
MTVSFPQLLQESMLMLDYGYYLFEKVFEVVGDLVLWRKFAPRSPLDVYRWEFDEHGGPDGVTILNQNPEYVQIPTEVFIPIWKLALFTFDMEAGDVTGTSVLRSAYKHWFMKENLYKIDAIQKERHGIGIPIIQLPPNYDTKDMALADEIGRNLRTNEKAHIVLPPNWVVMMLKLEGQPLDVLASIEHHDQLIYHNVLGQFMAFQRGTSQSDQVDMFVKSVRYVAECLRDVFNRYCIPQWVHWNYPTVTDYPELRVRRIGDTVDWRTISFAIRNFVGAGILVPDDPLEEWVREEMDLPVADPTSARPIISPVPMDDQGNALPTDEIPPGPGQDANLGPGGEGAAGDHMNGGVGGNVKPPGMPRQSSAKGNKQAKGAGSSQVGNDKSGG